MNHLPRLCHALPMPSLGHHNHIHQIIFIVTILLLAPPPAPFLKSDELIVNTNSAQPAKISSSKFVYMMECVVLSREHDTSNTNAPKFELFRSSSPPSAFCTTQSISF
mmetsp:Transcript_26316/g.38993  ORF Transcript_26316/g.38993 Transcript_26316/m.38993 type:complete len:108 (+) Transcript_26316:174-497(+)